MNTQRVAETPANYLERVEVTIRNDGDVDIDTAALVITVFGATAGKDLALDSSATKHTMAYRQMPDSAWTPVGAYGMLLNGAVDGSAPASDHAAGRHRAASAAYRGTAQVSRAGGEDSNDLCPISDQPATSRTPL